MPASVIDSAIYRDLFGDAEVGRLFSDGAEVRAMLLVEGALARAQGEIGMIPETAAVAIERAARDVAIDPASLAPGAAQSAVPVPALVSAFRAAMNAPEHAQFVHWGATSQDIVDTALALRLRQVTTILADRLEALARALAELAEAHADLPMTGRTYGQPAVPTTFGATVAAWGGPLLRHRARLDELRPRLLRVSLSGAAGTLSAMGSQGAEVRAGLAARLDLADPSTSWHSQRDTIAEFAAWLTLATGTLGKMGEDLILLAADGEVRLGSAGGSSTMPQKQNPVGPSVLVALARHVAALDGSVQGAALHRQQRDGAAWFGEWLALPQMCLAAARALDLAREVAQGIAPDPAPFDALGLVHAETITFALAQKMPRPEAQKEVGRLCGEARENGTPVPDLLRDQHPEVAPHLPQLGTAPDEARAFAAAVRSFR